MTWRVEIDGCSRLRPSSWPRAAGVGRAAARQHHHRAHRRHQVPDQPGVVAGRHEGGVPLGRGGQAGPVRRHARQRAGGAHRLPGRSRPAAVRHRRVRLGVERRDPVRQGRPALDGVASPRQGRRACRRRARRRRRVRAVAGSPARSRSSAAASIWVGIGRGRHRAAADQSAGGADAGVPVFSADGRWLAFTASARRPRARGPAVERADGALDGERHARAARSASIAAQGGDVGVDPTVGATSGVQFAADGVARLPGAVARRQDDARSSRWSGRAAARAVARPRRASGVSPTNRDVKLLVSPDGKSLAFVSDRTGWIHVYVMPLDATAESQAVRSPPATSAPASAAGRPTAAHRLSPQRAGQPDGALRRRRGRGDQAQRADRDRARRQPRPAVRARRAVARLPAHRRRELARSLRRAGRARGAALDAAQRLDAGRPEPQRDRGARRR